MLSIAKLRVGQEAYQLTGVAASLDDYYTGSGEAPGIWVGTAAERLGLEGEVEPDDLKAVMAGIAPATGGHTPGGGVVRPHPRRVPGFDLCFKVPKSVSALYAVSDDPGVQGAIIEAGDAAVAETLGWLEREAIRVRRGSGDAARLANIAAKAPEAAAEREVRVQRAVGVAGASFRHRTSRAGDPLLHWHVLVPNLVEGLDGRWSAFVHPELYRNARAAGEVFQTHLRAELTARLGLEWRPGQHVPEVAGVPQHLCDRWSTRSAEVAAWLEEKGLADTPANRQEAVLATRQGKRELEGERFDTAWKAEAIAAGWGPEQAEELLTGCEPVEPDPDAALTRLWRLSEHVVDADGQPQIHDRLVEPDEWIRTVLDTDLTMPDACFTRPQLTQLIAARLGEGATVATIERISERVLSSPHVIPIDDQAADERHPVPRWTSRDHLDREERLLATARHGRDTATPVPDEIITSVLDAHPHLGDDQATAVQTLAGGSDAVAAMIGPAGTGKTTTLAAIRAAYEHAGYHVIGAAPSARAALGLTNGTGMPAATLHRLRNLWSPAADLAEAPGPATVLVVDEAGMAATRELEPVITTVTSAGGRVLLVGDHRQLPSVTAGGAFAAIATDEDATVAALETNRRQTDPWEQDALAQLRSGDVATAVDRYQANGRLIVADDQQALITDAVDRWFTAQDTGQDAVLLAGTNEVVDALNRAVRRELVTRGHLPAGPALKWGERDFVAGDRVVVRRNSYRQHLLDGTPTQVLNGETGTVIDGGTEGLAVQMDTDNRTVAVPGAFIADGHLDHAWALTVTRAQGGTWDVAIGVGLDGLYREAAYTMMSRGRTNWLVLTRAEADTLDTELDRHNNGIPLPGEPDTSPYQDLRDQLDLLEDGTLPASHQTAYDQLTEHWQTSRAKALAATRDPDASTIANLADTRPLTALTDRAQYCRRIERTAARQLGIDPDEITARLNRARQTAAHVAAGQRIKAHDQHNIGTITGLHDDTGEVQAHFVSADGQRQATRTFTWDEVTILDRHPEPRHLTPDTQGALDRITQPLEAQLDSWHQALADHGVEPGEATRNERADHLATTRAARQLTYTQPDWLHQLLGPRPGLPAARGVWDDAVHAIAAHRLRHNLDDAAPGLGPEPMAKEGTNGRWATVSEQVARSRIWLDTHHNQPVVPLTRTRSTTELHERHEELDQILDTAPPDMRGLIEELRQGDTTSPDVLQQLEAALDTHDARRDWILAHWPHVIEHAEIQRALDNQVRGPEPTGHLATLSGLDGPLGQAAADHEPWLATTLGQLVPPEAETIPADTLDLLTEIATYRQQWGITHSDPLGPAAETDAQAIQRTRLTTWIDEVHTSIENQEPQVTHPVQLAFDDLPEPLEV